MVEPSLPPESTAIPIGEGSSSFFSDLAQITAERDEARRQLQEVRAQRARIKSHVARQKEAIQQLCFWLSHCGHSFALHLPPSPPWWQQANTFLKQHFQGHVEWATLPAPPAERTVLREPTLQEMELGAEDFVEQFVPRTTWPAPRPVSPDVYRTAMESLQDTPMTHLGEAAATDSEEEDPAFVRRTRRRRQE